LSAPASMQPGAPSLSDIRCDEFTRRRLLI
jgi:hypothetical protein